MEATIESIESTEMETEEEFFSDESSVDENVNADRISELSKDGYQLLKSNRITDAKDMFKKNIFLSTIVKIALLCSAPTINLLQNIQILH